MSLQTCHCCGWSKVTTYQGLRIHQGRMGCTPAGVRVAEPEQKYLQGFGEHLGFQVDLKLDVHTTVQTESTYYDPDLSLQVCHCGWSKMTTYRGLRIHQGKMGCTPQGVKIPKTEQNYWKNYWEQEVDPQRRPPAERAVINPENFPPRMGRSINSAAAAITEEHKSPPAVPLHSSILPLPGHQLEERFARPQVNGPVRGDPSAVRAKKNIKSQTLPHNINKGGIQDYRTDSCDKYSTTAGRTKKKPVSLYATPKVSTKSKSLKSKDELLDFASFVQMKRLQDRNHQVTSSVQPRQRDGKDRTSQVNSWIKVLPDSYLEPVFRPKEKHLEARRVKQLVREQPSAPPVVPVKKEDSQLSTERQEGYKSQLLQENQKFIENGNKMRKGKVGDIKPTEPIYQNVLELQREFLSSVKTTSTMEENKSPFQPPPDSLKEPTNTNPSAAEQMNRSVRKHLKTPAVVPPMNNSLRSTLKPKNSERSSATTTQEKEKLEQKVALSQSIDSPEAAAFVKENQSPVKSPKESLKIPTNAAAGQVNGKPLVPPKKKKPPLLPAEPKKSESAAETENLKHFQGQNIKREEKIHDVKPENVADVTSTNNQSEAAEIPSDDPTSESTEQPDITTGRTVKDLAKLFSVITNQPTEELKHSQEVKRVARWLSAIKTQEPAVQPEKEKLKLMQNATDAPVPHKASAAAEVQQREAPASLSEAAESGMKVRELARRFSLRETSGQLKEKNHREEHKPSQVKFQAQRFYRPQLRKQVSNQKRWTWEDLKVTQKSSDSTGAATKSDPAAHDASQMSGFSNGLKVKDLVRRFSTG